MPNSDDRESSEPKMTQMTPIYSLARATVVVAMVLVVSAPAFAQTARERYQSASVRDEQVRVLLTNTTEPAPASDVRSQASKVMASFESLVRRFPTSGYADNALWQAASLAEAAYLKFNRPEDQDRAVRLYRWLVTEYPASSLVRRANQQLTTLLTASPTAQATLTGIQRTVLPDTVRITLELDREVAYHEERIAGPARLFFDLKGVQLTPALMDKVLTYPGDIVSKIRVGRHPESTVRVVLDLEQVSRYSVFTLYSPFRLVIDAERAVPRAVATLTAVVPTSIVPELPLAAAPSPTEITKPTPPAGTRITVAAAVATVPSAPPLLSSSPTSLAAAPPPSPTAATANGTGGFSMARQLGLSVSRIVIDAGHGGHDPGVLGKGLTEAALVLDLALRLEKLLLKEPGVEVVLTRRTDVYIPLEERTGLANRESADMFLSIHANASRNATAKGIETYFLSFASSPEAEAVAARENSASAREMHQLPDIIKAIALNNKLDESRDLAHMVQESLVTSLRKSNQEVRSRGVKKAPFVVLIGAAMPSVLAEISFVSNRQELSLLKTAAYKQKIAESLFNAVMRYRKSLKGQATMASQDR
ncbi:MAG: N-acetylmuramoyl-L-alanine amidase [Acidobacteria bacterium]|nr:N-acetylmuramoyl-L-alanine amidase [Acidobacteriota bacterium]